MTTIEAKAEAEKIIRKVLKRIGSNCEHDSYCDEKECNRIKGLTICKVDWKMARLLACDHVEGIMKEIDMYKGELNPRWLEFQSILIQLEKK